MDGKGLGFVFGRGVIDSEWLLGEGGLFFIINFVVIRFFMFEKMILYFCV